MVDEIGRRNAETVMQTLRSMDNMIREQKLMLDKFSMLISDLGSRILVLEQKEQAYRIKEMGTRATE